MRTCSICTSEKRLMVDKALLAGRSLASISREFGGLSRDALRNHRDHHISKRLATLTQRREAAEGLNIRQEIEDLVIRVKNILSYAETHRQHQTFLKAAAELRGSFELLLKIAIAINESQREQNEDQELHDAAKKEQELQKALSVLNLPELQMLMALQEKIQTRSRKIIIPEGRSVCDSTKSMHRTLKI